MSTVICKNCKTPWMDWKFSACPKCGTYPAPPPAAPAQPPPPPAAAVPPPNAGSMAGPGPSNARIFADAARAPAQAAVTEAEREVTRIQADLRRAQLSLADALASGAPKQSAEARALAHNAAGISSKLSAARLSLDTAKRVLDDIVWATGGPTKVTEDQARQLVLDALAGAGAGAYPQVSVTGWGSVHIQTPVNPVVCTFRDSGDGFVVRIAAPALLDFVPPPDFYEMLLMLQGQMFLTSIEIGAGQHTGQIMVEVCAKLIADDLPHRWVLEAVQTVHAEALKLISLLESITPAIGGRRAYA